jgi:hypothetical protein
LIPQSRIHPETEDTATRAERHVWGSMPQACHKQRKSENTTRSEYRKHQGTNIMLCKKLETVIKVLLVDVFKIYK